MRKTKQTSVFNAGTLVNVLTIPLLTGGFLFIGWYFTTNQVLTQYAKDIAALQSGREKDKQEFAGKFDTMNESLNKLNTHAALQDQQAVTMNDTLKQIRDSLAPSRR